MLVDETKGTNHAEQHHCKNNENFYGHRRGAIAQNLRLRETVTSSSGLLIADDDDNDDEIQMYCDNNLIE